MSQGSKVGPDAASGITRALVACEKTFEMTAVDGIRV